MRRARRLGRASATVAVVAVLVATVAACGGYGGDSASQVISRSNLPKCPLPSLDDATGTISVSIWHGWTAKPQQGLNDAVAAFNAHQDAAYKSGKQRYRIHVTASQEGKDYDEVFDKYARAASSKQLPGIIQLEDTKIQTIADSSTVLPAEVCMKADHFDMASIQPAVRAYYTVRGVYWPGFVAASEPILYYNKTHFVRAGLDPNKAPATLDEVYADAKKLKAAGIKHPLSLKLDPWWIWTWLSGVGTDVVDHGNGRSGEARAATFDTPKAVHILELFKKMQREDLVETVPRTPGNIDQYLAVATQKSSMLFETSAAATTIAAFLHGNSSGIEVSADTNSLIPATVPFPGIRQPGQVQASGAAMYVVSTNSPAVQAASYKFLEFMMSHDQMVRWHITTSYLPVASGAQNDPRIKTFWRTNEAGKLLAPVYQELASVSPTHPGPLIGPYGDFVDALKTAWEEVMLQGKPPGQALSGAQRKVDAALIRYHQDNG